MKLRSKASTNPSRPREGRFGVFILAREAELRQGTALGVVALCTGVQRSVERRRVAVPTDLLERYRVLAVERDAPAGTVQCTCDAVSGLLGEISAGQDRPPAEARMRAVG